MEEGPGLGRRGRTLHCLTGFPKKAAMGTEEMATGGRAHTAGAEANTKPKVRSRVGEPF